MKTKPMELQPQSNLESWLTHPGFEPFLGASALFKLEVLACLATGATTLAAVARNRGVTRQAANSIAKKARREFGL